MKLKELFFVFSRYLFILLVGLLLFELFYKIFAPSTLYPSFWILDIFYNAVLSGREIIVGELKVSIIDACVAGSAYFFLLALNFSVGKIKIGKRMKMVFFALIFFLILNILRIVFLSILYFEGAAFFDIAHKIFWFSISIVFVIGIWFAEVRLFDIKEKPFYSDIKRIFKASSLNRIKNP